MAVRAQRGLRRAAGLSLFLWVVFGVRAFAADQPTAVLAQVSGAPSISELSAGQPRQVSLVRQGKRYELPIEVETGANDAATFALVNSVIEVSPNSLMRIVAPENQDVGVVQRVLQQAGYRGAPAQHLIRVSPLLVRESGRHYRLKRCNESP